MENRTISTKQRIYHGKSDYIDETADISWKIGYIMENRIISTKISNISSKIGLYLRKL
ncbi:hypothetical protein [Peribacillus frigoritolerans]|uniref:Uncharacterized protein n=1 Tax=Peribacillus castrilensis TaxID=2897690 RepID=A0AAW9NAL5_9BACI|nr:hypothetical protein [Peribacillus castrilensis]